MRYLYVLTKFSSDKYRQYTDYSVRPKMNCTTTTSVGSRV